MLYENATQGVCREINESATRGEAERLPRNTPKCCIFHTEHTAQCFNRYYCIQYLLIYWKIEFRLQLAICSVWLVVTGSASPIC